MLGSPGAPILKKRDMLRPKLVDPRGVLHARMTATSPGYGRFWPDEDLSPFVEHLWTVAWDLEVPTVSEVLAHPSVQLVVERDASAVAGVFTGRFVRRLEGSGRVLGVTTLGPDLPAARAAAERAAGLIAWDGLQRRHDIAATLREATR